MANIIPTQKQAGALSFSALATTASASDTVQNADLVALTTGGLLQTRLKQTYADTSELMDVLSAEGVMTFSTDAGGGGGGGGITPIDPVAPPAPSAGTINVPLGGDIQTAINAAPVGGRVLLAAGTYTVPGALTINKALTLQGAGQAATIVQTAAAAGDPVVLLTISVSNVVVRDLTLKQRKTLNTSVEAAAEITASTGSSGHFFEAVTVETMEFGIKIKSDGWQINNCHLAYVGPNNSTRRLIGIYRSDGQGLFVNSTYDSGQNGVITGSTRVVQITTGAAPPDEVLGGYLRIGNITPSNAFPVHQFFNCDAFVPAPTPLTLFVDGCVAAETSAFVVFVLPGTQPPLAQCAQIVLQDNTLTNAHGKGAIGLDRNGTDAVFAPGSTTFYASGNTIASTSFLVGWASGIDGTANPAELALLGYRTAVWSDPNQTITPSVAPPTTVTWGIDGSNKPVLNVQSAGAGVLAALRVAFAYSADL